MAEHCCQACGSLTVGPATIDNIEKYTGTPTESIPCLALLLWNLGRQIYTFP